MNRSHALRFESELDLERLKATRRDVMRTTLKTPERDVLAAVLELGHRHPAIAWLARANTGSGYLLRADQYHRLVAAGHIRADEARFMRFGIKGAADLTGMLRGGRRLEIECKADRGVVSDEQKAFGEGVNGGGGLWILARGIDDVMRALNGSC